MSVAVVDGLLDELGDLQDKRRRIDRQNTIIPRMNLGRRGVDGFYCKQMETRLAVTREIESVKRRIAEAVAG